jgi:hypothetical protein
MVLAKRPWMERKVVRSLLLLMICCIVKLLLIRALFLLSLAVGLRGKETLAVKI